MYFCAIPSSSPLHKACEKASETREQTLHGQERMRMASPVRESRHFHWSCDYQVGVAIIPNLYIDSTLVCSQPEEQVIET